MNAVNAPVGSTVRCVLLKSLQQMIACFINNTSDKQLRQRQAETCKRAAVNAGDGVGAHVPVMHGRTVKDACNIWTNSSNKLMLRAEVGTAVSWLPLKSLPRKYNKRRLVVSNQTRC